MTKGGRAGVAPTIAAALTTRTPLLWLNPGRNPAAAPMLDSRGIYEAQDRLTRAARLLARLFPEMEASGGIIESPLLAVPRLQESLGLRASTAGRLYLKADHALPVAGSIKARGGFHEVLAHAERLALEHGLLNPGGDLLALASPRTRELFSSSAIAVGSTGNLGMSIGLLAAALGFDAVVHMSSDAKAWKKAALGQRGVRIVEHVGDYESAVAAGRIEAAQDPKSYFVDDENSQLLFMGYAAAAAELAAQLEAEGRTPSADQPLFVYIPCGVGGAPGGISFGLHRLFGEHVHCFFAEPVASPCMLVQLAVGVHETVSVYDFGLDNRTQADGLAVPRASPLAASAVAPIVSGIYTVTDEQLFAAVLQAWQAERLELEPSAVAAFYGPQWIGSSEAGQAYVACCGLGSRMADATHVLWSTGGAMVPGEEHLRLRETAKRMESMG